MYTDIVLFIVGGACALIALISAIYLIVSGKQSKMYRSVLQQETELFDALTTTDLLTSTASSKLTAATESIIATEKLANEAEGKKTSILISGNDKTEYLDEQQLYKIIDFDAKALEGRYTLLREIHGGGMSRIFLAENVKLGNKWIVKFISNKTGKLANEENILKLLNHISLPKIVDIFSDEEGIYIVESYVEGMSLDKVLESGQKINQFTILDWAEQLAQVLTYLHTLEPHPIFHFDLKPSNIMVTHDNRLALIDFGISKKFGDDDASAVGVTYNYAAPEQLKHKIPDKHLHTVESRFGELPADRIYWTPDARTDIYSLGVILFELATGQIPTMQNVNALKDNVSSEMYAIIIKCLALNPDGRYQSAKELLIDLQKSKSSKIKMARALFTRKLAAAAAVVSIVASAGSTAGGYYVYAQENMSLLDVDPEIITLSLQQSIEINVEKLMPDGKIVSLDLSSMRWDFGGGDVARIDGNRVVALNLGQTEIFGKYRNKGVSVKLRVVEPMDGMVDISQRYVPGRTIRIFAGTTERDYIDGGLSSAEFVSPESIDIAEDGTIYIADSGLLRKIKDGQVESMNFEPDFLTPHIVRCFGNDLYILTDAWEDEDGVYFGIIKFSESGAEGLYIADAKYTAIEDFAVSGDGLIYAIERNEGVGITALKTIDPEDVDGITTLCELPKGTAAIDIGDNGDIYLANAETGVIQTHKNGNLSYFAGVENEKAFIDGYAPLFYMPQRIRVYENYLYVWDFNTLRRVAIVNGAAGETISVAGEASPVFEMEIGETEFKAEDVVLPNSKLMGFAVEEDGVLVTDPKRGVVWVVE